MKTILVTGAGGFLGGQIAKDLLAKKFHVRHLSRSAYPELEKLGIECFQGDLQDFKSVDAAVQGCDAIIHSAAKAGVWGDFSSYYGPNVIGTKNLIESALKNNCQNFIYTSSPSVVFGRDSIRGQNEKDLNYPNKFYCSYSKTKAMAEEMVLKSNSSALKTLAIRPHLIFGPGDPHLLPRLIEQAKAGKMRIVGNGLNKVDITHVKNASHAHLLALEQFLAGNYQCAGEAFFIAQERPIALWSFFNQCLQQKKIPPLKKQIPYKLAYYLGAFLENIHRLFMPTKEPRMTRFIAMMLAKDHYYSHQKAHRLLGYKPIIQIDEAIKGL